MIAVVFGLGFSAAMLGFGGALFRRLGGTGGALDAALLYSAFTFLAALPIWIVNLLSAALRGIGNVRVPALVTLAGALILVPLSPGFIFGVGPLPGLGVAGAGVAVTLYYCGAAIVMLRYMIAGNSGLRLTVTRLRWALFRDILGVGLVASVNAMLLNLTVLLVTAAVGQFGGDAIGGYGTASRLDYILIPLLFGMGTATLTMVGANVGAKAHARARRIAWVGAAVSMSFTELIGLAAALFPALWIGLFSRRPEIMETGSLYLRVVGPTYAASGLIFALNFAAQGAGRMAWPFLVASARLLIAAGGGWVAVSAFGCPLAVVFAFVAAASIVSALIFVAADLSGAIFAASVDFETRLSRRAAQRAAGALMRNHATQSAGRNSSVSAAATASPPATAKAIGPPNTVGAIGIMPRMAAAAASRTGRKRRLVASIISASYKG